MYVAVGNIIRGAGSVFSDIQCILDTSDMTVQMVNPSDLNSSGVSVISANNLAGGYSDYMNLILSLERAAKDMYFGNFINLTLKGSNSGVDIGLTRCAGAHNNIRFYLTYFGDEFLRPTVYGYIEHYNLFGNIDNNDKMDGKDIMGVEIPYEMYLYLVSVIRRHNIDELNKALAPVLFANIIGKGYKKFTWLTKRSSL